MLMNCVCHGEQLEQLLAGVSDRVETLSLVPDMTTSRMESQLQVGSPPCTLA